MTQQKDNIEFIEEGMLITFKDKSCAFVRKGKILRRSGNTYMFNDLVENKK